MPDSERQSFVDTLALCVEAWDAWESGTKSRDDGKRLRALRERRGIDTMLGDMLSQNPVELARVLVALHRRVEYLVDRLDAAGVA